MNTREIIEGIANGSLLARDIREYIVDLLDAKDVAFQLFCSMESCDVYLTGTHQDEAGNAVLVGDEWMETIKTTGLTIEAEKRNDRILNAIAKLEESYGFSMFEEESSNISVGNTCNKKPVESKSSRGKGRPQKAIKDCMIDDEDGVKLSKIHQAIKGKIGKEAALIILACVKKGWMTTPTYTQVVNEFGDIGSQQGFSKYMELGRFRDTEIIGAMNSLD